MDSDFISINAVQDGEEDEMNEEEQVEEGAEAIESGAEYNIEDILKKAAITLKRQLDKLELESGKISFGTAVRGDSKQPPQQENQKQTNMELESGFEKKRFYLRDIRKGDEETPLPSAIGLNSSNKLRREIKKPPKGTGSSWGFMKAPTATKARRQEYKVILLRDQLDPKRRYKRLPDRIPKVFQIGRVVAGPGDFYSGRMTRKERKNTLVDELLADRQLRLRAKRKYSEVMVDRKSGGAAFVKARKEARLPKWKKNL